MWSALALVLSAIFSSALGSPSFPTFDEMKGKPYNVSYDKRALTLNGEHVLFISGAVHPPRVRSCACGCSGLDERFISRKIYLACQGSPQDWDSWIALAKKNNINMLQVYIFWNFHEEEEGVFNFEGRGNLTLFMQKAAASGLFVNLRVGPYVCAEWTYGGLPAWLGLKPGVAFRQTNAVWQPAMEAWFNIIIDRMAKGSFFASQGGPIVLVQVENELPSTDKPYVEWCGTMAHAALAKAGVDVPITMCNGQTADDTINTCNGNDCSSYLEHHGQNGKVTNVLSIIPIHAFPRTLLKRLLVLTRVAGSGIATRVVDRERGRFPDVGRSTPPGQRALLLGSLDRRPVVERDEVVCTRRLAHELLHVGGRQPIRSLDRRRHHHHVRGGRHGVSRWLAS